MERIGDDDIMCNYGASFILFSTFFGILIVLTLLLICISQICVHCEKLGQMLQRLKRMIFWNALIRYVYLSTLKLTMISVVALKLSEDEKSKAFPIVQFGLLNILPLFFAIVLAKNGKWLEDKDKMAKYGALYKDKNVQKSRRHRAWAQPLTYFYRRSIFSIVTVYSFD